MSNPVEELVRRLHDEYAAGETSMPDIVDRAVHAALELAAETVEKHGNDYSWKHHKLADAIRALIKEQP